MDNRAPMIGKKCPSGIGGRDCTCCGQAPGKDRVITRRRVKRSDRNRVRRLMEKGETP